MNAKNVAKRKTFFLLVFAFFIVLFSFTLYSIVSSFFSLGEVDTWDGETIATQFSSGNGTEDNPYIITGPEEFLYFKSLVEGDNYSFYQDKYYQLSSDIDFGEHEITPIGIVSGEEERVFKGTFNGNGYTLKNFIISSPSVFQEGAYYSLFSKIEGQLSEINLENYRISSNGEYEKEILSGFAGNIQNGIIQNISMSHFSLSGENTESSILAYKSENTSFQNIYVNGEVSSNTLQFIGNGEIAHVLSDIKYEGEIRDWNDSFYYVRDNKIYLIDQEVQESDILSLWNDGLDSEYYWKFENGVFNIFSHELNVRDVPTMYRAFNFSIQNSRSITLHDTGYEGTSVYLNDLDSDYNYYMGRNYTEFTNTDGVIPNGENHYLYSDSNLANVYIRYSSSDINDAYTFGTVSVSEDYRDFYYYKKMPVVDGYIEFNLLDNPWANRPNGRAFNGWVTDYEGAVVSFDVDSYIRTVRIPVSSVSEPISITFYASWTKATVVDVYGDISTGLKDAVMVSLNSYDYDMATLYVYGTVSYRSYYPTSDYLYSLSGSKISSGSRCNTNGGCEYVNLNTSGTYSSSNRYYTVVSSGNNRYTVTRVYPEEVRGISYYDGGIAAGYFKHVTSGNTNIYSNTGQKLTSCGGSCYQLLQYSDGDIDSNETYYYLVTRDTNIYAPSETSEVRSSYITTDKPMTITGIHNGVDRSNSRTIRLYSDWTIGSDIRIEHITFYTNDTSTTVTNLQTSGYEIIGNFKNVKLGRGLRRSGSNLTANSFIGGANASTSSLQKYQMIVESGYYQTGSGVGYSSDRTHYVNANIILGSDFDRAFQNDSTLIVYYCYAGTWASSLYNSTSQTNTYNFPSIYTTVKSGSYGMNHGDYAAGVYAGGRGNGTHYSLREVLVEGGNIYNLIGGPMSSTSRAGKNDVILNVKGGTVTMVFGGAGASNSVGNRILNITGGTIEYGILGGSNAYIEGNSSNPYGKIDGDTFIYVGGDVTVGNQTGDLYYVDSGNIFGAGNGRRGELDVGSVNNSHVIIAPGARIAGSVYGGGNFGAVGGSTVGTSSSSSEPISSVSGVYEDTTSDRNLRYYGSNPDNYIQFNGETYRIIGLFNNVSTASGNKNLVRIIKNSSITTRAWGDTNSSTVATNTSTETSSGGWFGNNTYNYTNYYKNYYNYFVKNDGTKSSMYNYLNTNYYGTINSTYQNYIQSVNWGLGSVSSNNLSASSFYTSERGNGVVNYLTGVNQTSNGSSIATYDFKVGLFYPSDYGFANNTESCFSNMGSYSSSCRSGNWLNYISNAWSITPSSDVNSVTKTYQVSSSGSFWNGYTYNVNRYYHTVNRNFIIGTNSIDLRDIYYTGNDNDANNYYNTNAVYPSFYLKDDVTIVSGTGTQSDPYVIGSSENTLTQIVYRLAHPESGEEENPVAEDDGIYHEANDYQARTLVHVLGGTISGSIYGAGNNNGAGNINDDTGNMALSKVQIEIDGGSISGSIYGGSNEFGRLYGDVYVHVVNGSIGGSVYGGGKGGRTSTSEGTFVSRNIDVHIGDVSTSSLTIEHSVYGGSALGIVNGVSEGESANSRYVRVKVNNGIIRDSIFGGGEGDSSHQASVYGNVYVHMNGGNATRVFGGNDANGEPSAGDIVYLNGGIVGNAFGGGNNTGQSSTDVRLQGTTITENVYGGSNVSGVVSSARVTVSSGSCVEAFGGNNLGGSVDSTIVKITGGIVSSAVYGGGNQAGCTTSSVKVLSCSTTDVYGGGKRAGVSNRSQVALDHASVSHVFGGSNILGTVAESFVQVDNSSASGVYGGNNAGGTTINTHITTTNSSIIDLFGGGDNATSATSHILIESGQITNVYGGGNEAGLTTSNVEVYGGDITYLFGGSNVSGNITDTNVTIGHLVTEVTTEQAEVSVQVSKRAPGNYPQSTKPTYATVTVTVHNLTDEVLDDWEIALDVPSSELFANYSQSDITISGDTYTVNSVNRYYGYNTIAVDGTYSFSFEVLSDVALNDFDVTGTVIRPETIHTSNASSNIIISNLYGGNNHGGITNDVSIQALDGQISNIFGGGNEADVYSVNAVIDHVSSSNIFGGGNEADVLGPVTLDIDRSSISENLYGGGNEGKVTGNTSVTLTNSTVLGNAFAGGNGEDAIVHGSTTITIDGKTKIGNENTTAPLAGCVFGSGNAAATGRDSHHSNATVNIVGGEIFGNVYGGPKMSVVHGTTTTNIGTSVVSIADLVEDNIIIHGTVFGGGESNADGSETYDYTFISVTDGIDVNINGNGYDTNHHQFIIHGSIFGSGNASSSAGESNILIKNLGSMAKPNQAISIQRASNLVIDASVIELFGTTDRTNEYSDIIYSFNLIDKMIIKNNTTLLLQHNVNMLKEIYSGVDEDGEFKKAKVDIDSNGISSINVDNRIYMNPGQNLNIAVNASANAYGKVSGMTFFGMYTTNENNAYRFGLYSPNYTHGDSGNESLEIVGGSYVVGLRSTDHDITKDGFYTNSIDEVNHNTIVTSYIDPTPIGETGYRWIVGFEAIEYNVELTISKYSSFGTQELSMIDFADGDTIFTVLGFYTTELDPNVVLIDSNAIPRVATSGDDDRLLGLSIKAETQEWLSSGTTKFLSAGGGDFTGDHEYITDSRKVAPSLMFYSYHPKNFSRVGNLGKVVISMQVAIPKNEIDYTIKYVTITVTITSRDFADGVFYDASISYDKKYEMPAATSVNITNQSQFTTYFSLTEFFDQFKDVYGVGNVNYHVITFSESLPVDTVITMLDYGTNPNRPEYYYYRVTDADYTRTESEISLYGEAAYPLSRFIKMDSTSSNNTYNDTTANLLYYDENTHLVVEEFIFIIDFKETSRTGTHLDCHASFELRNSEGWSTINVVSIRDALMNYNTYDSSNVLLSQVFENVDEYLYYNVPDNFHYSTNILYNETQNRQPVIDTNYEYSSMGLNIVFYDRTGALVRSGLLAGTSITIGNHEYFADVEGVYRIKLAGKVSNIIRDAKITVGEKLPAGTYTIRYTLFASEDGLHNSTYQNSVYRDFEVVVVSNKNYISVDCTDGTKLVYGETSLNYDGSNINDYTINYRADLAHPAFRVKIYKRDTDTADTYTYSPVLVRSLFNTNFTTSDNTMYLTVTEPGSQTFHFQLADELLSGTYRIDFLLYDGSQLIDEDTKYVIVQKNIE